MSFGFSEFTRLQLNMTFDSSSALLLITGVLLLSLWCLSTSFRYYCKMLVFHVVFMLASCFAVLVMAFRGRNVENYGLIRWIVRCINTLFGIRWEVRGAERFARFDGKPCVIIANHQSSLDVFGMMEVWPLRCVPLCKRSLQFAGPLGLALMLGDSVFIDRFNRENALAVMANATNAVLEKNLKLWVFPEGTRNHEGAMLAFKKGAFHMAVQAQIPIVPVVFSDFFPFYSKIQRRFSSEGFAILSVLDPIETQGLTDADVSALAERARDLMLAEFERISPEAADAMNRASKKNGSN